MLLSIVPQEYLDEVLKKCNLDENELEEKLGKYLKNKYGANEDEDEYYLKSTEDCDKSEIAEAEEEIEEKYGYTAEIEEMYEEKFHVIHDGNKDHVDVSVMRVDGKWYAVNSMKELRKFAKKYN